MEQPRILIGTLYSGENEYEECLASLRAQNYPYWEQQVFSYLPNKKAHDTLYRTFSQQAGEFDYFLKLDADMVLKTPTALGTIVELLESDRDLDRLEMVVDDRFSNSLIMGVNVFSRRARWQPNAENLFVDSSPHIPGKHLRLWQEPAPLVAHCPNPSPFQAYHFGVHRALKAWQPQRSDFNYIQARSQWQLLGNVWQHFSSSGDRRLGLAILGAEHVIQGHVEPRQYNYTDPTLAEWFATFAELDTDALKALLVPTWRDRWQREGRFWQQAAPRIPSWLSEVWQRRWRQKT